MSKLIVRCADGSNSRAELTGGREAGNDLVIEASSEGPGARFTALPPDHFGVHVADEMDEKRLLWLVNEIGEAKLRRSVEKYHERYPDARPFVSRLLKDLLFRQS
jgi:hypothetical protein